MNLLHEGEFRVDKPFRAQHSRHFSNYSLWIQDMLQHGRRDYTIERLIHERYVVRVAKHVNAGTRIYVNVTNSMRHDRK